MLSLLVVAMCVLMADGFGIPEGNRPVRSELVTVRFLSKRSTDGTRQLHVRAFGEDHHLHLEPSTVFSPNFKTFAVRSLPDGGVAVHTTVDKEQNKTSDSGTLYNVKGRPGSLYVNDEEGKVHVEGILDEGLRIEPHNNGSDEGNHVVYKEDDLSADQLPLDYIVPNVSYHAQVTERMGSEVPDTVNLEILLLFDHVGTKRLGYDDGKIKRYVGVYWNRVNQLYTQTSNPRVNLVLSGLVYFNKPEDQPFINNNQVDEMRALESLLPAMGKWLKDNENKFDGFDVAFLQLAPDIGKLDNGKFVGTVGGVAYMGGACGYIEYRCAYGHDRAPSYSGLGVAAHELAHTLKAAHDSDTKDCPNDQGYIMSGGQNWKFSQCSLNDMRDFIRSDSGKCTWESPTSRISLIDEMPADSAGTLDEQCQVLKNDPNYEYKGGKITDEICKGLHCGPKGVNWYEWYQSSPEGTPCGDQKICKSAECVDQKVLSLDEQCHHFGNDYVAWFQDDTEICERLWCTKDHRQLLSIGGANKGSLCTNGKGICISGICYI